MPEVVGSVLFGADELVAALVKSRLSPSTRFRDYAALGVVRDGVLCGGVVYHNYCVLEHGSVIEASFAFDNPRWAFPATLRTLFAYPFGQLGCDRMTAIVAKGNKRSRKMVEGLGFKLEGVHPRAMDGRQTALSYGILKEDCRWIGK
jgi:RimJ/RimL family protein N-acetyltransferase